MRIQLKAQIKANELRREKAMREKKKKENEDKESIVRTITNVSRLGVMMNRRGYILDKVNRSQCYMVEYVYVRKSNLGRIIKEVVVKVDERDLERLYNLDDIDYVYEKAIRDAFKQVA